MAKRKGIEVDSPPPDHFLKLLIGNLAMEVARAQAEAAAMKRLLEKSRGPIRPSEG